MISVEEALEKVLTHVNVLEEEEKPLLDCLGQVLAEDEGGIGSRGPEERGGGVSLTPQQRRLLRLMQRGYVIRAGMNLDDSVYIAKLHRQGCDVRDLEPGDVNALRSHGLIRPAPRRDCMILNGRGLIVDTGSDICKWCDGDGCICCVRGVVHA